MKKLVIALLILSLLPVNTIISSTEKGENIQKVKLALLLDTSNSMDGLINQAKSQLWNVVNKFSEAKNKDGKAPILEIALFEYGNDGLSMLEGYIRLVSPFTTDLDHISEQLFALKTNGGSEYCGHVLDRAYQALDWGKNEDDLRLIYIAGNEGFDQGTIDYKSVCGKMQVKDIKVNTIFCGPSRVGINQHWKDGADLAGGIYLNIEQDNSYRFIASPYDKKIMQLNDSLNATYLAYGNQKSMYLSRQLNQDLQAKNMGDGVALSRIKAKSSQSYKNADWDIVDAVEDDVEVMESIEEEALPDVLKGKSIKEKKQYIESLKKKREKYTLALQKLNRERDAYIADKQATDQEGMLDNAIISTIVQQAQTKNIRFEKNQ